MIVVEHDILNQRNYTLTCGIFLIIIQIHLYTY